MTNFSSKKIGIELYALLEKGYDLVRISRWAYGLLFDNRREFTDDLTEVLNELGRMEDDPQFEYSEQELKLLCNLLIHEKKNPLEQLNQEINGGFKSIMIDNLQQEVDVLRKPKDIDD